MRASPKVATSRAAANGAKASGAGGLPPRAPLAEVADQRVAGERAEALGRDRHSPRRVERAVRRNAGDEVAVRSEHADETEPRAVDLDRKSTRLNSRH